MKNLIIFLCAIFCVNCSCSDEYASPSGDGGSTDASFYTPEAGPSVWPDGSVSERPGGTPASGDAGCGESESFRDGGVSKAKRNNGHGNNCDGVDVSNPSRGRGGPNGKHDFSANFDDECRKHFN